MDNWFEALATSGALSGDARRDLVEQGFAVVPGPIPYDRIPSVAIAYEQVLASADSADVRVGSTTTRITDFVNRDPVFDPLYVYPPALDAACALICRPFRLSTMHARTVRAHVAAQELHMDFEPQADGWPMLGFIYMVDEFRPDNGATRFVSGSQGRAERPSDAETVQLACGPAGSLILFNGSVWHGHAANTTPQPRRSIQGAYIRREASSGSNLPERMRPDTLARITPLARYLLAV